MATAQIMIFKPSRKKADVFISVYLIAASLSHSVGAGLPDRQLTPLSILCSPWQSHILEQEAETATYSRRVVGLWHLI